MFCLVNLRYSHTLRLSRYPCPVPQIFDHIFQNPNTNYLLIIVASEESIRAFSPVLLQNAIPHQWSPDVFLLFSSVSFISDDLKPSLFINGLILHNWLFITKLLFHVTVISPWLFRPVKASPKSDLSLNFLSLLALARSFHFYCKCYRFERVFFTSRQMFFILFLPHIWCIYCHNLVLSRLPWGQQFSPAVQPPEKQVFMLSQLFI